MRDLILFGVQGSGKGTQARLLAERMGYKIFETGKELRALIADEKSELGKKIKDIVEGGNLVSDDVVIEIVESFLKEMDDDQAVIFDGLPRKISQKDLFEEVMNNFDRKPVGVVVQISDDVALERLSNRWMSKSTGKIFAGKEAALEECEESDVYQREDDKPEAIKIRLKNYHEETQPVIAWYMEQGRGEEINGEMEMDKVTEEIAELVKD